MFCLLIFLFLSIYSHASETPIIGILSQETYTVKQYLDKDYKSFIAASYVKYLESAGARVLPIWIGQKPEYYQRVVNYTNGILFPGGGTYFNESGGYGEAAMELYKLAFEANKRGVYYPMFGICLGMQALAFADAGKDIRTDCSIKHISIPLNFEEGYKSSRLYTACPEDLIQALQTKNLTYNQHRYCLTQTALNESGLLPKWKIITTNKDDNNIEFISTMESLNYPFYGVQFHPEKNCFEFKPNVGFPHTVEAVKVAQYFGNFFVEECRKNNNSFPTEELEKTALIYNYSPLYIGLKNAYYEQIYVFQEDQQNANQLVTEN